MSSLIFPTSPVDGELYPAGAGESGKVQWKYDETAGVWNIAPTVVALGSQSAYNEYTWPDNDGNLGAQLTTSGGGDLSWEAPSLPALQHITLTEDFDGVAASFTMVKRGTTDEFSPFPTSNLVVFIGSVLQEEGPAYSVTGSTIEFTEAPPSGASFYAFSSINQPQ
ncbi:putative baseplate wedge initiator [Synechococcus phage S-CBWM1]|uniref:Putative baseplate wedge initiator n=1 Tax=Synechococcus phage S-CBWM1 TaxID=2053653 RepID=A0A3G1L3P0_9CAUD|nr:putative baseplate wedge initiator [Synechococcus phage S-CBWM1]ATW62802.1 putative baseplate wedge initiator [Synechococcus phage S-CBWM1]